MPNKAILNRQIQILEQSLRELTKAHNQIVNDINKKVRCEDCKKVMIEHAKKKRREFNKLSATLLGTIAAMGGTDYSAEPYKLFEKDDNHGN
jgi:hypothetical protein